MMQSSRNCTDSFAICKKTPHSVLKTDYCSISNPFQHKYIYRTFNSASIRSQSICLNGPHLVIIGWSSYHPPNVPTQKIAGLTIRAYFKPYGLPLRPAIKPFFFGTCTYARGVGWLARPPSTSPEVSPKAQRRGPWPLESHEGKRLNLHSVSPRPWHDVDCAPGSVSAESRDGFVRIQWLE